MSIIHRPKGAPKRTAECVVCRQKRPLSAMGAGMYDADEHQAFACDGHFRNRNEYIIGWIDFAAAQREKREECALTGEYADDKRE